MRKLAIDRLTPTIANGRLKLELASGERADLALPTSADDLVAVAALRTQIEAFGRRNDLTRGQINAAYKKLTEHGYYVTGPRSRNSRVRWILGQLSEEQRQKLLKEISN